MPKTKHISNHKLIDIAKIFFGIMFGIILFPSILKSIVIIIFSTLILFLAYNRGFKFNKSLFFINSSVYMAFLGTLIYTSNISEASFKLQTTLSLFIFPLLFSLLNKSIISQILKNTNIYLAVFVIATFLYNIVPFFWFYFTHYNIEDLIKHYPLLIYDYIGKYGIHPIYMSMHCSISIIFSIYLFKDLKSLILKIIIVIINLSIFLFLIIYSKKGPIIGLGITIFSLTFFKENKIKKYYYITVVIMAILFTSIPKTRNSFSELLKIEEVNKNNSNSTNIRYSVYQSSFYLFMEAPFTGYSIGDYNEQLKLEYKKNKPYLLNKNYNSHNQYLSFLLIGGIPLLLLYFYILYYNIKLSLNHKNYLLINIICFYSIVMMSENILERENGVIFFAFFINYFALNNYVRNGE